MSSRPLALAVLCVGQLMVVLDGTIVNIALPDIQSHLDFSSSALGWVVNAYLIPFAGLLLLSGRLGDLFGRKQVFVAGLALFTAASALCGLAQSPAQLLAARFLQGVGGAVTSAVPLAMLVTLYPELPSRARALGVFSFVQSAGGTLGLLLGGVLTRGLGWHWIFLVNVPVGVVTTVLARRVLSGERGAGRGGTDVQGAVLITAALMTAVYAIVEQRALIGVALVLLAGFAVRQSRAADPLVPFRFFRNRTVVVALGTHALLISGIFSFQFLAVLYMQKVLGFDEIGTGLGVVPVPLLIGVLSLGITPKVVARFGPRGVLLAGLAFVASGLGLLGTISADGAYLTDVFPATVPLGIGFGLVMPALAGLAMSGATEEDSGLASGMFNTVQQVGASLGLAVLSSLAVSRTAELLAGGTPSAEALTDGYRLAFRVSSGFVVAALALAALLLRAGSRAPAPAGGR